MKHGSNPDETTQASRRRQPPGRTGAHPEADASGSPADACGAPLRLALIGYRGAGKTTVARQLGLAIGLDWVDADVEIELRAGKSIAAIFADDGEAAFRDLESQVLTELLGPKNVVLAAGGGAVLREENRRVLAERARVVWLRAAVETILGRVAQDATTAGRRPNLTTAGGAAEVIELLREREPLYRQCAEIEIDTEGKTPPAIAVEIIDRLQLSPQKAPT
ncbi:MAG TPA: shikimate kinase [Pirellulales bacterium]|nr:shikimate kinase [Pirellulales bacterium]